ncbi:MAG: hypothetical protein GY780_00055 [bacterium]|nr:hypothetical protein [bacterium]
MILSQRIWILLLGLLIALSATLPTAAQPEQKNMVLGEFVAPADSFPKVRYYESDQVTLNDRCPVRKVPLNPKMMPVFVNNLPIGFC